MATTGCHVWGANSQANGSANLFGKRVGLTHFKGLCAQLNNIRLFQHLNSFAQAPEGSNHSRINCKYNHKSVYKLTSTGLMLAERVKSQRIDGS